MARTKKADKVIKEKSQRKTALAMLEMPDEGWDESDPLHDGYIKKDKRGRPTVMTKQTVDKLRTAFKIGCTDEEACIHAGIDKKTLYNYCEKNPDFSTEKEELKQVPIITSRAVVVDSINRKSVPEALWYLTRKRKAEFADMKVEAKLDKALTVADLEALESGDIKIIGDNNKQNGQPNSRQTISGFQERERNEQ